MQQQQSATQLQVQQAVGGLAVNNATIKSLLVRDLPQLGAQFNEDALHFL